MGISELFWSRNMLNGYFFKPRIAPNDFVVKTLIVRLIQWLSFSCFCYFMWKVFSTWMNKSLASNPQESAETSVSLMTENTVVSYSQLKSYLKEFKIHGNNRNAVADIWWLSCKPYQQCLNRLAKWFIISTCIQMVLVHKVSACISLVKTAPIICL